MTAIDRVRNASADQPLLVGTAIGLVVWVGGLGIKAAAGGLDWPHFAILLPVCVAMGIAFSYLGRSMRGE